MFLHIQHLNPSKNAVTFYAFIGHSLLNVLLTSVSILKCTYSLRSRLKKNIFLLPGFPDFFGKNCSLLYTIVISISPSTSIHLIFIWLSVYLLDWKLLQVRDELIHLHTRNSVQYLDTFSIEQLSICWFVIKECFMQTQAATHRQPE